ncbi:uncharacterized protein [Cicer arietinum]|uniref:uncharacterized protein n=1 Tax=Cicer arietinum TaxID=3827 RepID=UPI003CC615FD
MDEEFQLIKDQERFTRARDGTILFSGRIWVPTDSKLKRLVLEEAHKSNPIAHLRSTKMYQDLKKNYWWPGFQHTHTGYDSIWVIVDRFTNYHAIIGMAPFEALYERKCRTPLCWLEVGDKGILGPKVIQETTKKIKAIKDKLRISQSRQKSYVDIRRRPLEFEEGDRVFLELPPLLALEEC